MMEGVGPKYYNITIRVHISLKSCGFRIRRYDMSFCNKLKTFVLQTDIKFYFHGFLGDWCKLRNLIEILERGQAKCLQYYDFERDGGQAK